MALFLVPPLLMASLIVAVEKGMLPPVSRRDWLSLGLLTCLVAILWWVWTPDYDRPSAFYFVQDLIAPSVLPGLAGFLMQRGLRQSKISPLRIVGGLVCLGLTYWILRDMASVGGWSSIFSFIEAAAAGGVALVSAIWLLVSLPRWRKLAALLVLLGFPMAMASALEQGRSESPEIVTERNGSQIVRALNDYYAGEGKYPASLIELVPTYLPAVPEALTTQGTGWMFTGTGEDFTLGYWDWPEKMGGTWVCLSSSKAPNWDCAPGNWGPFREVPTPTPDWRNMMNHN